MNIFKNERIGFFILLIFILGFALIKLAKKDSISIMSNRREPSYIVIGTVQAKERYDKQTHIFVDARRNLIYRLGHIKNAVNFPSDSYHHAVIKFEKKFPKNTGIVIYCDGSSCSSSYILANMLTKRGYKKIEVFYGGWNEWVNSSFPIE